MELWRKTWRVGFAPQLSEQSLESLAAALEEDSPLVVQGVTTVRQRSESGDMLMGLAPAGCCPIGYCGWHSPDVETANDVEGFFSTVCFGADERIGEPHACRYFLQWVDGTPRDEMRAELLAEVRLEFARRKAEVTP